MKFELPESTGGEPQKSDGAIPDEKPHLAPDDTQKSSNLEGKTYPSALDEWKEYLLTNPSLVDHARRHPRVELNVLKGRLEGDVEGLDQWFNEGNKLKLDMMRDQTRGEVMLSGATFTGDIRVDAENLFRSIGAEKFLARLAAGAKPLDLLNESLQLIEVGLGQASVNEDFRSSAYTLIQIKSAIKRIIAIKQR